MSTAADNGRGLQLQDRDLHILRSLFEARIMTAEHIAAVHFGGRYEAARKRVGKLKAAGYIGERPRRPFDPAVLSLRKKGFAAACQAGILADLPRISWPKLEKRVKVSPLTLQHELDVQTVRAAFYLAAEKTPDLSIAEFSTWPRCIQFDAMTPTGTATTVKPDGFIRIHQQHRPDQLLEHLLFLEVDRSTEPLETLAVRAACYRDFYRRGGMAKRRGEPAEAFEKFPFRVLMIFKSVPRRDNIAAKLLTLVPPILTQTWLCTYAQANVDPFGEIWMQPADYRKTPALTCVTKSAMPRSLIA